MIVGTVTETKTEEYRVALTPQGAADIVGAGHTVLVEAGAGFEAAVRGDRQLWRAVNTYRGQLTHPAVAASLGREHTPLDALLAAD